MSIVSKRLQPLLLQLFVLCCVALVVLKVYPAYSDPTSSPSFRLPAFMTGGDVSELAREEQLGGIYKDNGVPGDALLMFRKRGCNLMRIRLWVNPTDQGEMINDLPYTISLGRRIKRDGFKLLLDLHYSDGWADPGKQSTPEAWQDLPFDDLVKKVHDYSRDVITAMRQASAMPDMVEVGNEINNGILWPSGHVEEPGGWAHLNALLRAGIAGVREGSAPEPEPRIMIHIAGGAESYMSGWFYGNLEAPENGGSLDFDVMGFSYYPDGQKTLDDLRAALAATANTFHKPIIVVETGYPSGVGPPDPNQKVYQQYGVTPEGQKQFLTDLIATVKSLPPPYGRGVVYWAPEWLPLQGLPQYYGDNPLFDHDFNAKPALDALTPN